MKKIDNMKLNWAMLKVEVWWFFFKINLEITTYIQAWIFVTYHDIKESLYQTLSKVELWWRYDVVFPIAFKLGFKK